LRLFNQSNQTTGEQSRALAGSVVAYAAVRFKHPTEAAADTDWWPTGST
jgi:hemoglobin-like flavoprotein